MYVLCIFAPLIGSFVAGFFGSMIGDRFSQVVTCTGVFISMLIAYYLFFVVCIQQVDVETIILFRWFDLVEPVYWALRLDVLTVVMLVTVSTVSLMVHVYSIGYMSHDKSIPRFHAYLSLFTFMMFMLVTSDNLIQLFFGWEGVGVASYLLIGFWFHKHSANAASIKAFLVNRVGDFGFALGIFYIFMLLESVQFDVIFSNVAVLVDHKLEIFGYSCDAVTVICMLFFIGAMGKSAQLGLHVWLPDAMEGPTPVSALIHAATMVTAGVFMLARMSPIFEYSPDMLSIITFVGATTAFFAATIGCVQNDIKKIIAYSTCSQLGYMFFAIGVSAYEAAIFHLMTHAFFKALLFLGAGSIIHAMSEEQDIRKMGGIWRQVKITYVMMWIGSLALVGLPFFSGYYSKDIVLEAAYAAGTKASTYAFVMGLLAAFMTAFYSWRLLILTFHGTPRADKRTMSHIHESPLVMLLPLLLLALGALFLGAIFYDQFVGHDRDLFWRSSIFVLAENEVLDRAHDVPMWIKISPIVIGLLGIALAYYRYAFLKKVPGNISLSMVHQFFVNKWYIDELYNFLFVKPYFVLGRFLWNIVDIKIIDAFLPNGLASSTKFLSHLYSNSQTGFIYHYASLILLGALLLMSWIVLRVFWI